MNEKFQIQKNSLLFENPVPARTQTKNSITLLSNVVAPSRSRRGEARRGEAKPPPYDTFFAESGRESNPAPLSFPPWALLGFSLENVQCCDPAGRARQLSFGSCPRTIDPILRRRF
ncbi:unnamed protein product, partial [Heterotrigona itama]